ncbi:MAG: hypothetical protein A3J88_00985 [Melioribacter sp. RIFOXYB12_FULL_38_5]|nr:MAG: hypothetical protein A3J88_00985 [Melioribacter sp. RIFOXYB12_FULL_38_5]
MLTTFLPKKNPFSLRTIPPVGLTWQLAHLSFCPKAKRGKAKESNEKKMESNPMTNRVRFIVFLSFI